MSDVVWHEHKVSKSLRQQQNGHRSCVIWFTGLSGAGKSSVAGALEWRLVNEFKVNTYLLDGDNVRSGLCIDLGFSEEDRVENIRRVGELSKLFVDAGLITLSAFISPFENDRRLVRDMFPLGEYIEVFVDASLEECERRDPKGMYVKARRGEIANFTGIDSPYEPPEDPEVALKNDVETIDASVQRVVDYLISKGYIDHR